MDIILEVFIFYWLIFCPLQQRTKLQSRGCECCEGNIIEARQNILPGVRANPPRPASCTRLQSDVNRGKDATSERQAGPSSRTAEGPQVRRRKGTGRTGRLPRQRELGERERQRVVVIERVVVERVVERRLRQLGLQREQVGPERAVDEQLREPEPLQRVEQRRGERRGGR